MLAVQRASLPLCGVQGVANGSSTTRRLLQAAADNVTVYYDVGGVPEGTIDSELFGHEKGAFTGANEARKGYFEVTDGGTIFLDEIAEMPLGTQARLLRVLENGEFIRVGSSKVQKTDVRVVAATNVNLLDRVQAGKFREDLYYRLAVVPIRTPSLKERREDIPELARTFIERSAETSGIPGRLLSADAMTALQAYDWPGNVRQLRNLMDWLLIMAPGTPADPIRADMLPPEIGQGAPALLNFDPTADIMALPLREARDLFETQYLEAQLLRFSNNISRTAGFVGMERSALHRKLKQLGVNSDDKPAG